MSEPFHHRLMTALDNAQKGGAHLVPAFHGSIRRALRESNMAGKAINSVGELRAYVGKFAPYHVEEAARFAA